MGAVSSANTLVVSCLLLDLEDPDDEEQKDESFSASVSQRSLSIASDSSSLGLIGFGPGWFP